MRTQAEAIKAKPGDVAATADAIAAGFFDNEIWEWIVPSDRTRARLLRSYYRTTIRRVFVPMGTAWTTPGHTGGALWFPPGCWPPTGRQQLWDSIGSLPWIGLAGARRGIASERVMSAHHPTQPHWYLQTLAVDPVHQRSGHGTALLAPVLRTCDERAVAAYLETQRESNLPYYARFGFELVEQLEMPDGPPLWTMWRPAPDLSAEPAG